MSQHCILRSGVCRKEKKSNFLFESLVKNRGSHHFEYLVPASSPPHKAEVEEGKPAVTPAGGRVCGAGLCGVVSVGM